MNPKQIEIPITEYSIQADWYEGAEEQDILLTFVGYSSSKERNGEFVAKVVADTALNALVIDLSGHGESPFDIDETMPSQHVMEAVKAYDWLKTAYPERAIHVMGTSYGGYIASYLTRYRPIAKLVLRTPAIYKPEDFYTEHKYIDKITIHEYRENTDALAKHPLFLQNAVETPEALVIVHSRDEDVPAETTNVYRDNFNAEIYTAEGFKHAFRDSSNPQEGAAGYYEAVCNWLRAK